MSETQNTATTANAPETKFCKECGEKIAKKAVVCPKCGCQVENTASAAPQIVIENQNQNVQSQNAVPVGKEKNKWTALLLLLFFGAVGGHKFYEGKVGMGVLYIFTLGLLGVGVIVDFFTLLFKPTHYYV